MPETVRQAATVVLVREGRPPRGPEGRASPGPEVFLLRRSPASAFAGGAYVFPGGAVDDIDRKAEVAAVCEPAGDAAGQTAAGQDRTDLAWRVAAVRECFEEAGALLAYARPGELVSLADPAVAERFRRHRAAVCAGGRTLAEVCRMEGLRLAVDRLHPLSHWLTPAGMSRRYDTRFFVAAAPPGQQLLHDDAETTASLWVAPAEALARYRSGQLAMVLPTVKNLEAVGGHATVAGLLRAVDALAPAPTVRPRLVVGPGGRGTSILLPGDTGYGCEPGAAVTLRPGVVRILAPNPGPLTGPGTNTYLVGTGEVAVIDPGPDDQAHLDAVAAAGQGAIRWILVTHHHPDHAGGGPGLSALTGAPVLGFGAAGVFAPDRGIGEGFVLSLGDLVLRALHTPGHAADHLCFLVEGDSLLFSGDHVIDGSTVVIAPPDGDMARYLEGLERLASLRPELSAIAPGHGGLISDPGARLQHYLAHRLAREAAVASALARAGPSTARALVPLVYADVDPSLHLVARASLWAHLRKLGAEGRAMSTDPDDPDGTWRPNR